MAPVSLWSLLTNLFPLSVQTNQGIKNLTGAQAAELSGCDPDYATRDLYNAIASGNYPSYTMYIQVMTFEEAENYRFNPFDLTKVCAKELRHTSPLKNKYLPCNYF